MTQVHAWSQLKEAFISALDVMAGDTSTFKIKTDTRRPHKVDPLKYWKETLESDADLRRGITPGKIGSK